MTLPDGSLDTTFNVLVSKYEVVYTIAVQPDDKILFGGYFNYVNNSVHRRIARLNPDGSIDEGFKAQLDYGEGASFVGESAVQIDGKILIAGFFSVVNGQPCTRYARLNPDGSFDSCLNPNQEWYIEAIAVQPDGKVLVGGSFKIGNTTKFVARFHPDGTLDATFNAEVNDYVVSIAVRQDGKILIGGSFTQVNGVGQKYLALLDANGSTNSSLNVAISSVVADIVVQDDSKILIAGYFNYVDGMPRNHSARLRSPIGR